MSVDYEANLVYGWRLQANEIPNFDEKEDNDWKNAFLTEGFYAVLLGHKSPFRPWELVTGDDAYASSVEQDWFVGLPLSDGLVASEFVTQLDEAMATDVYTQLMGHAPEDPPEIWSFVRQW